MNKDRPLTGARIETIPRLAFEGLTPIAPSRGRGLKQRIVPPVVPAVVIAPSRGRGLKLCLVDLASSHQYRPLTGARIETRQTWLVLRPWPYRPLTGARIETQRDRPGADAPGHRPLTGARIETTEAQIVFLMDSDRPLTGARIETTRSLTTTKTTASPPHGGAD